jgi:hypothetical protein
LGADNPHAHDLLHVRQCELRLHAPGVHPDLVHGRPPLRLQLLLEVTLARVVDVCVRHRGCDG